MRMLILDTSWPERGGSIGHIFCAAGAEVYWQGFPGEWRRLPQDQQCENPQLRFDAVLLHETDAVAFSREMPKEGRIFRYTGGERIPLRTDWIQRPMGLRSIPLQEAKEFADWITNDCPNDLPAILRPEDPGRDLLMALAVLCQVNLTCAARVEPSLGSDIHEALASMGWGTGTNDKRFMDQELSQNVKRSSWWVNALGIPAGTLASELDRQKRREFDATSELARLMDKNEEVGPPTLVARAYMELANYLSPKS